MSIYLIPRMDYYEDINTQHYASSLEEIPSLIRLIHENHEVRNVSIDIDNKRITCEMKEEEGYNEWFTCECRFWKVEPIG